MPILNYTTQINFEKTISEIQKCLVAHGANKIIADYREGLPTALTFCLEMKGNMIAFSLPANYEGVLRAMKRSPKIPQRLCTEEQALRVSWRIVKDWIEAQMAIVDAELVAMAEVFLPYAVHKSGTTLYKFISENNNQLLLTND